jgi:flagellar biosynthesis protein FliQ
MTLELAIDIIRHTLITSLILISPLVIVGVTVGLTVSLIQSITSLQEQTLTFIPKLVAVCLTLMVVGNWMMLTVMDFTIENFQRIEFMAP